MPHVAAGHTVSEAAPGFTYQPCAFCGFPLAGTRTGSALAFTRYAVGECVGKGCSQRESDPRDFKKAQAGEKELI